jgi:2-methylcitrate dehydratase PrpD
MGATHDLAAWLLSSRLDDIPVDVRQEARRALLNFVGCAIGGCREDAVDIAIKTLAPYSGAPTASVLGRSERFDPLRASLMNGIAAHVHDYDDTTPKNYVHPSAPVLSALFAFASTAPVSGRDFIHAFILGFEATSRIANAVYPAHYDAGWHITGTAGVFGAAVGIAHLRKLALQNMIWAIGLAATQAAGVREMFGSMGKAFHPGRSAEAGYLAALLAENGFTSGIQSLEGPRGFAAVQAARFDLGKVTARIGIDFDVRENTYKPYPCGIVIHPTIEACINLRNEHRFDANDIREVNLTVAPLVLDLCNKQRITAGLEGKFSVYHAAAIGLVRGRAGLREFTDETVNAPEVRRVRELAKATADPAVAEDAAKVEVVLADGRRFTIVNEHAVGNLARPMSDQALEEKFRDQTETILPRGQVEELIALCWKIEELDNLAPMIAAATPADEMSAHRRRAATGGERNA